MKNRIGEFLFQALLVIIFTSFTIICIYPFYYIFIYSLSDSSEVARKSIFLLPAGFTINNYLEIFKLNGILHAFFISASRTIVGTLLTVFFSSILAYSLTKKKLVFRNIIYKIIVISMYINAGLIPWYIIMLKLGMKNNYMAYILPFIVSPFLLILVKTYIEQIPPAIEESAIVDGAGYFTIFMKIILPLCKPILAAIAVFSAVGQWNSWVDNFFLATDSNLMTLQLTVLNYLRQADALAQQAMNGASMSNVKTVVLSSMSIRMTITMVVTIPIIIVYPILQKHFVKGIMLGAVKG